MHVNRRAEIGSTSQRGMRQQGRMWRGSLLSAAGLLDVYACCLVNSVILSELQLGLIEYSEWTHTIGWTSCFAEVDFILPRSSLIMNISISKVWDMPILM